MSWSSVLLGKPLPTTSQDDERVGPLTAVPILGLDALASAAYGPEAALTVLMSLGAAGPTKLWPLTAVVILLLFIVQLSYRQTIASYPQGGGSYTVARENLGPRIGLLAASALVLDYVLNVAVAISAGVSALVSVAPTLLPYQLPLCLLLLVTLTLVNLRGVRATGTLFGIPTYLFVVGFLAIFAVGILKVLRAGGHPLPMVAPPPLSPPRGGAEDWLPWTLVRAYAAGCTALTGVEAVSNAVPIFREPRVRNAQRTLTTVAVLLSLLLLGGAVLVSAYQVGATPAGEPGYRSVLSQLVAAIIGEGSLYVLAMAVLMTVLCLSANTSFADFPRLCRALALDGYLPEVFAHAGRRLVFSTGIIVLAAFSGLLLVVFGGLTERLVHLFAVGAFLAFTCSQAGMVLHWRRKGGASARRAMAINGIGAVATALTLVVVLTSKALEGAWITLLILPACVLLFSKTRAHYRAVDRRTAREQPFDLQPAVPPLVVVPIKRLDRVTEKGLQFGLSISRDVRAVQVRQLQPDCEPLSEEWERRVVEPATRAGLPRPRLEVLESTYRDLTDPLLRYLREECGQDPHRTIAVVIPELVERRWYHYLLHSHTATLLKMKLLFSGGPRVVVISTPWSLDSENPLSIRSIP